MRAAPFLVRAVPIKLVIYDQGSGGAARQAPGGGRGGEVCSRLSHHAAVGPGGRPRHQFLQLQVTVGAVQIRRRLGDWGARHSSL